jgi:hypothetical protein
MENVPSNDGCFGQAKLHGQLLAIAPKSSATNMTVSDTSSGIIGRFFSGGQEGDFRLSAADAKQSAVRTPQNG